MVVAAGLALLLSVILLIPGLRGRAIDDHPLCRRCGFDLTGKPSTSTSCPECGRDVTTADAVRIGHRRRRLGWIWAGGGLAALSLAGIGAVVGRRLLQIDPTPYEPSWYLIRRARVEPPSVNPALTELTSRLQAGRLSAERTQILCDFALSAQAGGPGGPAWDAAWGRFVENAQSLHQLDRPRWARYLRQAFMVSLQVRQTVMVGYPIPTGLSLGASRLGAATCEGLLRWKQFTIDGQPVSSGLEDAYRRQARHYDGQWHASPNSSGWSYSNPQLDLELSPGPHTLHAVLHTEIYDPGTLPDQSDITQMQPRPGTQLDSVDVPLQASFVVTDFAHTPPVTVVDPAQRAAVKACVHVDSITGGPAGSGLVVIAYRESPVRLQFSASIRTADGLEHKLSMSEEARVNVNQSYNDRADFVLPSHTSVDVILRPDADSARRGIDLTPIWGEPVEVDGVPVK